MAAYFSFLNEMMDLLAPVVEKEGISVSVEMDFKKRTKPFLKAVSEKEPEEFVPIRLSMHEIHMAFESGKITAEQARDIIHDSLMKGIKKQKEKMNAQSAVFPFFVTEKEAGIPDLCFTDFCGIKIGFYRKKKDGRKEYVRKSGMSSKQCQRLLEEAADNLSFNNKVEVAAARDYDYINVRFVGESDGALVLLCRRIMDDVTTDFFEERTKFIFFLKDKGQVMIMPFPGEEYRKAMEYVVSSLYDEAADRCGETGTCIQGPLVFFYDKDTSEMTYYNDPLS